MTAPLRQKTGGREKGTPNKVDRKRIDVSRELERLDVNLLKEIWTEITKLNGKEKADCLLKLLEYCAPKMKAIEITENSKDPNDIDNDLDKIPRSKIIELMRGA